MALDQSAPQRQSVRKRLGQSRSAHPFLHFLHGVRHTPEFDGIVAEIRDRETGTGVAVSRLPHGARVQQISRIRFHAKSTVDFTVAGMQLQHF
jgi:hypothetical protein